MRFDLRRAARVLAVSTLLVLTMAPAVFAAPPGDIVLGDITVFRLTTAVGNVTADQRASMVQDRINQAISIPNVTEKDVRMVVEQSGPTIYVRKIKIVTIDPATAESQGVTPLALAKTWAHRLMGVIAQVCIRVPVAPPAGGGTQIAATPGQPTPATAAAASGAPAAAATTTPAAPNAAPATSPATPAATPADPAATPAAPAAPVASPTAPAVPASPATPADPSKPAPVTPPATPANPPAPASPATPPATPPTPPAGG